MADPNLSQATTTDFKNTVPDFIVEAMALDIANSDGSETFVYYDKATENYGYYFNHPQVASPLNSICTWAYSRGWDTRDPSMKAQLDHITGNGKENFDTIIWNHGNVKLMQGDSFAHVIMNKAKNIILNMINISPERVKTVFKGPRIVRYEIWDGKDWVTKEMDEILHSFNKKIGDSTRGTSQVQSSKNVNDAMIEAFEDERVIKHRDKALGIVYYKTNNTGKIEFANTQIEKAVATGNLAGFPEGSAEIKPWPSKGSEDRQGWLQYVENLGYQTGGVPRSIATSDGTSEVGGKMGHVIFEPIYTKEQKDMENDLWNQFGIQITFKRPPSLGGMQPELDESKNTGQVAIQPNDVEASITRE
ncbi:hypothetical protein KAR91_65715 [Candidatus Pacearchaeota archaeon]|nr:hypothetical protein [Candidatus Pacearchaeota archaeon]